MANAVLPCTPQELYNVLISGATGGTELYIKQHRDIGRQWDLVASGWRRAAAAAGVEGAPAPAAEPAPDHSLLGPKNPFEWVVSSAVARWVRGRGGGGQSRGLESAGRWQGQGQRCVRGQGRR